MNLTFELPPILPVFVVTKSYELFSNSGFKSRFHFKIVLVIMFITLPQYCRCKPVDIYLKETLVL